MTTRLCGDLRPDATTSVRTAGVTALEVVSIVMGEALSGAWLAGDHGCHDEFEDLPPAGQRPVVGVAGTLDPVTPTGEERRTRRPRVDDRAVLNGILFVAENGIAWKKLPVELGFGSGITCWRRLRAWQEAGVWEKLHHAVLEQLGQDGQLDWARACLDSVSVRAKNGAS